ncbi:MAG: helix-turn-helix domain-containing protein [Halothiobacillaceae bacterium]
MIVPTSDRLREERVRMGLSQAAFAERAGTTGRSQRNYESGERFPDSNYLEALAKIGVDVLYILTGRREPEMLSNEEKSLIDIYRAADVATRYRILSSLHEGKTLAQAAADANQVTQVITGTAGQVAGRDINSK